MKTITEPTTKTAGLASRMGTLPRILTLALAALGIACLVLPDTASARDAHERHHHRSFLSHLGREYHKNLAPIVRQEFVKPALRDLHREVTQPARQAFTGAARQRIYRETRPITRSIRRGVNGVADWIR